MVDYTDSYGSWIDIGRITPNYNWQQFPRDVEEYGGGGSGLLFRFVFHYNQEEWNANSQGRSYGLFTFTYSDDSGNFSYVDQKNIKLYPQAQNLMMEQQTFAEFYSNPNIRRRCQVKKIDSGRGSKNFDINTGNPIYSTNRINWELQIYYSVM
ncbi:MAG: hypothetical protein ACRC78_12650 [Planktothrix sp.]